MSLVGDDDTGDDGCEEDGDGREKIIRRRSKKNKMGSKGRMKYGWLMSMKE